MFCTDYCYVRVKPNKKFGFVLVHSLLGDSTLHYFKLKGWTYKSARKNAVYSSPNLGFNTLILQDLTAFKGAVWCPQCQVIWADEVETAKQIILANQPTGDVGND